MQVMTACGKGWIRLFGGTRCGFSGFGTLAQKPDGVYLLITCEFRVSACLIAVIKSKLNNFLVNADSSTDTRFRGRETTKPYLRIHSYFKPII